jgi:Asp-tRNA(Asn)/Glu-tRNA(Gln) amidotransferase C subunit
MKEIKFSDIAKNAEENVTDREKEIAKKIEQILKIFNNCTVIEVHGMLGAVAHIVNKNADKEIDMGDFDEGFL